VTIKYPDISVKLTGEDGNSFAILGRIGKAMKRAGVSEDKIQQFRREATSGDYNKVLQTAMQWVNII
jgi:hypothetical protein